MNKPGIIHVNNDVCLDLKDRQVKPEAAKSPDLLRVLLGSVAEPMMIMKPVYSTKREISDFVIYLANDKMASVFPHESGLQGKRLLKVFPALRGKGFFEAYVKVFESGKDAGKEASFNGKEGKRWFMQTIRKYEGGLVVTFEDITAAKVKVGVEASVHWTEVEQFIARLTAALPDLVYVYDISTGSIVYNNRSTLDMLGYIDPSEDPSQNIYARLAHPDDLEMLDSAMNQLGDAADGELVQNEFRLRHADGEYRWLASRSTVFKRDAQGRVMQIIGVLQDITGRKRMEQELKEKNEELVDAQAMTCMGNWIFNTATGESHWSDQVYELFGARRVPGESSFSILERHVFPEDLERIKQLAKAAIESCSHYQSTYRITRADGQIRVISTKGRAEQDKDGILVLKGICQDITEKWMADEKIRRSEALLQEAQRMARLGSWEWDIDADEATWTDELYRMYGYEPGEIKISYDTYMQHVHPDDRHVMEVSIRSTLVTQYPFHNEFRIIRKDGEERIISSAGRVITNENGKPEKMLGICLDITDRRAAEEEIHRKTIDIEAERRLNNKKDEFISIASHELKTPLTSLKAYIQLLDKLNREQAVSPQAGFFLSKAGLYVKRLEVLISDLLDVSKIESGKLQFTMEELDLHELLFESIENNRLMLPRHSVVVSKGVRVRVKGDKHRLDQVISNLLSNAAKYSPRADTIEVTAEADEHKVTIAVKDFGMGIEVSHLPRIFDRFYRAENALHSVTGLGLGLYISSEIVKRHDGRIWAESEPGNGSTFYFTLPILK
jgi:PAS domain S-box-containing protein